MRPIHRNCSISLVILSAWCAASTVPVSGQAKGEMLTNGSFKDGLAKWKVEEAGAKGKAEIGKEGPKGAPSLKLSVVEVGDQSWKLQVHQGDLQIVKGQKYSLTLWIKAAKKGVITINCMQNHAPWEHHGAAEEIAVGTKWAKVTWNFDGPWDDKNARITFTNLGTEVGQAYWFSQVSLKVAPAKMEAQK